MVDYQISKDDLVEKIACCVCDKTPDISIDECLVQKNSPLCQADGKCRIREKTKEQLDYICFPLSEKVFLTACPGSGKTEVVGLKAAYETKRWKFQHSGIAFLTFTNNATAVIRERVIQLAGVDGVTYPHYIGTIDSWFHRYIAHPFGNRITNYKGINGDHSIHIVENSSNAAFLNNFQTSNVIQGKGKIQANQYFYDLNERKIQFLSENNIKDEMRKNFHLTKNEGIDLRNSKEKFIKNGFATYQDIDLICYKVLNITHISNLIASRFPFIIVDECQDLTTNQLKIIEKLIRVGVSVHFVGDLQQSIFGFAGAKPEAINSFVAKENFSQLTLTGNFRSPQPIVKVCEKLVNQKGIVGFGEQKGKKPICIYFKYIDENDMANLPERFYNYLVSLNYIEIEKTAILARGHSTISRLRSHGDPKKPISYYPPLAIKIWQTPNRSIEQTVEAISLIGRFITEKVFSSRPSQARSYYCPDSVSSPIQWRLFLAGILSKFCINNELINFQQTWSKWAKIFNESLMGTLQEEAKSFDTIMVPNTNGKILVSPKNEAKNIIVDCLQNRISIENNRIRITTFHKVKGETLEAVLVVSSYTRKGNSGGHWLDWLKNSESENARFAYVASSRPKYLLAWAIPENSLDKNKLNEIGFSEAETP